MVGYIIKRLLYAIPIIIGVNIITFALFFTVNSPDDMAYMHLGGRFVTQDAIDNWKEVHGYDKPLFYNEDNRGAKSLTDTIFWQKSVKLLVFDFGISDQGRDISESILKRMVPSLALAIPALLVGVAVNITIAMGLSLLRGSVLDSVGVFICVLLMSISMLFYIVAGQYIFAKIFKWVPISGYSDGLSAVKFVILPIIVSVIGGIGAGTRWYRSFIINETQQEYVRTAIAKGLSGYQVAFKHILRNAMIPILTGIVVIIPTLFMGSLLTESFFGIPGLGSYTIDAIRAQDFAIVRAMVYMGSWLYIVGLILTDISYAVVDPRIKL